MREREFNRVTKTANIVRTQREAFYLRNHSVHHTTRISRGTTSWGKRIKFIKKYNTRACCSGLNDENQNRSNFAQNFVVGI